jgi:acyl-CoA dehydrogenase family member 9
MSIAEAERAKQVKEAEELLFAGPQRMGFAKSLFDGRFAADWVMPYPRIDASEREEATELRQRVRDFARSHIDADAIDRQADIPRDVLDGLARAGLFRTTAPRDYGGLGLSQKAYCQALEEVARVCGATALLVNVQHSIGLRALLMFGTEEQKTQWLPSILNAQTLTAFALTEPEAGSDAGNVRTTATPTPDGRFYIINGQKRYITSGALAGALTLMARTPSPDKPDGVVTAFLVTPDMPGFKVVNPRMEKLGCRGTATAKLAFENMRVPAENIFGKPGKGLRIALTVLDFGRVTFGALCTGAAKEALQLATEYGNSRRQFGRSIGEFELVRKKIARMAEWTYAMEAMTMVTADMIDRGLEDYMVETAMLKVYCTENLWTILNDAFQVHGGAAYFTDRPLERMLRDGRINQIGEGANEVLLSFIALVGMRGPGEHMKASKGYALRRLGRLTGLAGIPHVPVRTGALNIHASRLGRLVRAFDNSVTRAMLRHREAILDRQLVQERIANAAMEIFAMTCVLSRLDADMQDSGVRDLRSRPEHVVADSFLKQARRRIYHELAGLRDNDDELTTRAAGAALGE